MKKAWAGLMSLGLTALLLSGNSAAHAAALPPVTPTPLNQIDATSIGKKLTVEGNVLAAEVNSSGFRFHLSDGIGQVFVLVRDEDYAGIAEVAKLNVGAKLRATGKLNKNSKGQLQLVPAKSKDVVVLSASTPLASRARKYDLGGMNGNDANAVVLVEGKVIEQHSTAASASLVVLVLQDGTGAQIVVLPRMVAKHLAADVFKPGQALQVLGRVRATQKVGIQIDVVLPTDVQVI